KSALAQIAASTIGNGHHANEDAPTEQSAVVATTEAESVATGGRQGNSRSAGSRSASRRSSSGAQSTSATTDAFATPHHEVNPDIIEILDIPVKASRQRKARVSTQSAELILDNVLEALPEPKQPGQGRGRSRRVSTSQITAGELAPLAPSSDEGAQE
ncbi:MAG: hypothetical protein JJE28_09535, partial [Actinomycetales bacterium]|nr:hypothetical protein [Actinomycetales bacterium]